MTLEEKLHTIQQNLKAPKGQYNSFAKYNFRSCEDIIEAVKPLLPESTYLTLSDEIQIFGNHLYVVATATITWAGLSVSTTGCARETLDKKGMDSGQMTGTASSYARKYALNGLFAIDDTKDADTNEYKQETQKSKIESESSNKPKIELTLEQKLNAATKATDKYLKDLEATPVEYIDALDKNHKSTLESINARYPDLAKKIKDAVILKHKEAADLLERFNAA